MDARMGRLTPARIGYQGEAGSNSQVAAAKLAEAEGLGIVDFLGLVSSVHVVESLVSGFCDYGVVAIRNSFAGDVSETLEALADHPIHVLRHLQLPVRHCLFKLHGVDECRLTMVASHPQALAQTRTKRQLLLPGLQEVPTPDTAISARWLKEGKLPSTAVVICSREAGELHGLEFLAAGAQDSPDNVTEFILFDMA